MARRMADLELETVALDRRGGALRIVLDRPEALNAFDARLAADLLAALELAGGDDAVRAVVLTGAGRAFSSGADLRAGFEETPEGHPDVSARLRERYHPIIRGLRELPKPVVAAVNGPAAGIGCSVALACDLVLVAESAYFLLAFVNIGLAPDGGSSVFVPARAGLARAAEMAMLGERVGAEQALAWGLANRVVPDDGLQEVADDLAARLAAGPTRAYAGIKRQLNARQLAGMDEQLELEAEIQQELAASEDFREGVRAFLERRSAGFRGA
jgi:2-(1,2-epoxy-1,2-dihydrophenyl)acetyl-CoA isomerase